MLVRKSYTRAQNISELLTKNVRTFHAINDRQERIKTAFNCKGGNKIVSCFLVNKNHRNGIEYHVVLSNSTIWIFNHNWQLVTVKIPRLATLEKLYNPCGLHTPDFLQRNARYNRKTVDKRFL